MGPCIADQPRIVRVIKRAVAGDSQDLSCAVRGGAERVYDDGGERDAEGVGNVEAERVLQTRPPAVLRTII